MDKLKELLKKLEELDDAIGSLLSDDEEMDGDGEKALAAKQVERKKLLAQIERHKTKLAADLERAQLEAEAHGTERNLAALSAGVGRRTDASPVAVTDPPEPTVPAEPTDPVAKRRRGFKTPREFLNAVIDAGSGRRVDKRLYPLVTADRGEGRLDRYATVGSDEARGVSDPYGGFLVPEDFHPDFMKVEPEADPMAEYVRRIPMGRPIVRIPARTDKNHTTSVAGGITVTRRPETVAGTSSVTQMEHVTLEAHSLFGLSYATEELLVDSPESFIAILETGFSEQFTYQLINERLNGTGVGEFQGVLNSPALVTVSKQAGQAAKTVIKENIDAMRAQCWGYGNAIWIANHDVGPQLASLNQAVGTAGTGMIWMPSYREDYPDMLLGRPLIFSEYAQTLGTVGDLILGNWNEYLEGTYQPLESAESIHVRFINHERAFKFWMRNDARCWWLTALTPKYSSSLLSPFVVLATR